LQPCAGRTLFAELQDYGDILTQDWIQFVLLSYWLSRLGRTDIERRKAVNDEAPEEVVQLNGRNWFCENEKSRSLHDKGAAQQKYVDKLLRGLFLYNLNPDIQMVCMADPALLLS
jgi:hypothetical protein